MRQGWVGFGKLRRSSPTTAAETIFVQICTNLYDFVQKCKPQLCTNLYEFVRICFVRFGARSFAKLFVHRACGTTQADRWACCWYIGLYTVRCGQLRLHTMSMFNNPLDIRKQVRTSSASGQHRSSKNRKSIILHLFVQICMFLLSPPLESPLLRTFDQLKLSH